MHRLTTRCIIARTAVGVGSSSSVYSAASRLAMRRAAALRKWPDPQAGSHTAMSSSAAIRSADAGKGQLRAAFLGAEQVEDELYHLPQVAVAGVAPPHREVTQPARGEVLVVAGCRGRVGVGVEQHAAVLGDEPEQQPVHHPQE